MSGAWEIREGDALDRLREMGDESVQCCITSPPYFGLRDYGTGEWEGGDPDCQHRVAAGACRLCGAVRIDDQIGIEPTPELYVAALVEVFRRVRRVLRDDGVVWLNLGDSYNAYNGNSGPGSGIDGPGRPRNTERPQLATGHGLRVPTLKPKDLLGIPWMVAFALRADGWYLRSEVIWAKPNPMPESVTDRPTKAHEHVFLLSKSANYYYDASAVREAGVSPEQTAHNERYAREYAAHTDRVTRGVGGQPGNKNNAGIHSRPGPGGRNKRSVWTVAITPYADAHFATFPPKLIEPMVLAGSAAGDLVLDPFAGSGTTLAVAVGLGRNALGIELNPAYAELVRKRMAGVTAPLFDIATTGAAA